MWIGERPLDRLQGRNERRKRTRKSCRSPSRPIRQYCRQLLRQVLCGLSQRVWFHVVDWFAIEWTCVSVLSRRDRKSTRLNSSHVSISYAVFCLKKKSVNMY